MGVAVSGVRFTIPPDPAAVLQARRRVKEELGDLPQRVVADAELVVSELVTNSVLHAGLAPRDVIEVALRRDDERLVIEVDDRDGFFGKVGQHGPARRPGGMGLKLLDALCDYWEANAGRVVASLRI